MTTGGDSRAPRCAPDSGVGADERGTEPDARFSLANERTFLAWNRTALAIMAAAIGVLRFGPGEHLAWLRTTLAVVVALLGATVAGLAYRHWRCVDRAMRLGDALPRSPLLPLLAVVLTFAGLGVVILVIFG